MSTLRRRSAPPSPERASWSQTFVSSQEACPTGPTFSISTAIPYANGAPHIGHAYELIATDAIGRFKALDGYDTLVMTGMDEHGQKMHQTAARKGTTPQALADETAAQFEAMTDVVHAHVDERVRTTQARHKLAAQTIWRRMREAGDIFLAKYKGWYSVRDEAYFAEDELTVDADGTKRAPGGAPVEWVEEDSHYFKLSAYAERLLAHYEAHPGFIVPEKYRNEIVAFVQRGLNDLSISRSTFDWGIPVPDDPRHVMYVWVDALTNYLTGTGLARSGRAERALLADGRAHDRQGHHALPLHLLAGVPDVGRHSLAEAGCRARLPLQQGGEDVEVGRAT